ncbi:MAG: FlgD immunoglobulin-like domain containing protein [candidate division WOR-3 bacterium]
MFRRTTCAMALALMLLSAVALGNSIYVPDAPIPVAPARGQKLAPGPLRLVVQDDLRGITSAVYHFRVYAGDANRLLAEGYSFSPGWNVVLPGGELPIGIVRWTCRRYVNSAWSPWFYPEWEFEVEKPSPVNLDFVPVPISPLPGTKKPNLMPTLEVACVGPVTQFNFCVWRGDGNEVVASAITQEPTWTVVVPNNNLPPDIYTWSCRANVAGEWGDWFEPRWYFEVDKPAAPNQDGVQTGRAATKSVALPLVYPNPCGTNGADIQLSVVRRTRVALALYSVEGELIRTLLPSRIATPGTLQVSWDGKDDAGHSVAAGTYLCQVTTDDAHRVVKLTKSR